MDPHVLLNSLVYAIVGIMVFAIAFVLCDKLTPGELWRELIEKQNMAVAVVAGAVAIGICIIVAAAIH